MSIKLVTDKCIIRPLKKEDAESIALNGNSSEVEEFMLESFPHPFTKESALEFFNNVWTEDASFKAHAIEVDGQAIGVIGYIPKDDVHRHSAELGYWIGKKY